MTSVIILRKHEKLQQSNSLSYGVRIFQHAQFGDDPHHGRCVKRSYCCEKNTGCETIAATEDEQTRNYWRFVRFHMENFPNNKNIQEYGQTIIESFDLSDFFMKEE